MQTKPDSDLSSKSRNTKLIHYYCYFYWLAFGNEYLQYTICIFSTLVLKKNRFTRVIFPFNVGKGFPFMKSSYENTIYFPHNLFKISICYKVILKFLQGSNIYEF